MSDDLKKLKITGSIQTVGLKRFIWFKKMNFVILKIFSCKSNFSINMLNSLEIKQMTLSNINTGHYFEWWPVMMIGKIFLEVLGILALYNRNEGIGKRKEFFLNDVVILEIANSYLFMTGYKNRNAIQNLKTKSKEQSSVGRGNKSWLKNI